jgi:hypothetical protein
LPKDSRLVDVESSYPPHPPARRQGTRLRARKPTLPGGWALALQAHLEVRRTRNAEVPGSTPGLGSQRTSCRLCVAPVSGRAAGTPALVWTRPACLALVGSRARLAQWQRSYLVSRRSSVRFGRWALGLPWCNGSTADSESVGPGSNPGGRSTLWWGNGSPLAFGATQSWFESRPENALQFAQPNSDAYDAGAKCWR